MKVLRPLVAAALLGGAGFPAPAQQLPGVAWHEVGRAGSVLIEYTRSGLKREGEAVVAFSRATLVEGIDAARRQRLDAMRLAGLPTRGYERYLRQLRRSEYDCSGRRMRSLSVTDYDDAGAVLAWAATEGPESQWTDVPTGTIGAKLLDAVCAAGAPPRTD